jgi:uncharacterized repeat protein (TIGR01451 family)
VPSAWAAGIPWIAGAGLAAATVLVTPWSAIAATSSAPGAHHIAKKQADPAIVIGTCTFNVAGTTLTLTADCTTTATIQVPDGDTLDGAGHTIFAHDPAGGLFSGAVVGNAGPEMSLKDLTIDGEFGPPPAHGHCPENPPLWGVSYANAGGSMTNLRIVGMTRHGTCGIGFGIRIAAEDSAGHQAITITGCSVSDFQRGGLLAAGNATVDVSHSTFGPPDLKVPNPGGIAQNTVQYGSVAPFSGTGGVFSDNKVIATAFGSSHSLSAGMLIWDAANLTITKNTFSGAGTDIGVSVHVSRGIKIEDNHISRTATPHGFGDFFGFAVAADGASRAETTLVCNTFTGWRLNLDDVAQRPCIVTTRLPGGIVGKPYSAALDAFTENPHALLTWRVIHGSLPPGLGLATDVAVVGTPAKAGTFTFTVEVHDPVDLESTREFTISIRHADVSLHVTKTAAPDPAVAGQPVVFTITVANGGPDDAFGVTIDDTFAATVPGFTWACSANGPPSRCYSAAGTGPLSGHPVDVAAGGTVTFTLAGILPVSSSGQVVNNVSVLPARGATDDGCTPDCSASVTLTVAPTLPVTGPDLLPEAGGGTGLVALGGLILLAALRRKPGGQSRA